MSKFVIREGRSFQTPSEKKGGLHYLLFGTMNRNLERGVTKIEKAFQNPLYPPFYDQYRFNPGHFLSRGKLRKITRHTNNLDAYPRDSSCVSVKCKCSIYPPFYRLGSRLSI